MKDGLPSGVTSPAVRHRSSSSISTRYKWPRGAAGTGTGGCGAVNVMCHSLSTSSGAPQPFPCSRGALTGVAVQQLGPSAVTTQLCLFGPGLWKRQHLHGCEQKHQSFWGFSRCSPRFGQDEIHCCCKMMQHLWAGPLSAHLTLTNRSHLFQ